MEVMLNKNVGVDFLMFSCIKTRLKRNTFRSDGIVVVLSHQKEQTVVLFPTADLKLNTTTHTDIVLLNNGTYLHTD